MQWLLCLTGCVLGVRRGAPLSDSLQHLQSLLAQHVSSGDPVLAQLSALNTPGVEGNLSSVVDSLADVIEEIKKASGLIQDEIDNKEQKVNSTSITARGAKNTADEKHMTVFACRQKEESLKNIVKEKQLAYNSATGATREPCQREIDTSTFTLQSASFTLACDLSVDATCASQQSAVDSDISGSISTLAGSVSTKVGAHNTATQDCSNANATQIASKGEVIESRANLTTQYQLCQNEEKERHERVCTFGERLQDVCAAKMAYNTLISKVTSSGFPESTSDREKELKTTEMVKCILESFVANTDLTDAVVASCGAVDVQPLILDHKSGAVSGYLLQPNVAGAFPIKCQVPVVSTNTDHEEISIGRGASLGKNMTSNATYPLHFDAKLDLIQELHLPTYEQTIVYVTNDQTEPFIVDEAANGFDSACVAAEA